MDLAAATSTRVGEAANDQFAIHVEANFDADADGIGDYLSGATFNDAAGAEAGALYLWYGPLAAGIGSAAGADAKWTGVHPGEQVGFGVAIAGDVDGDGRDDMLASATGHEGTGAAYLVLGR
jgi:hypothetical protein